MHRLFNRFGKLQRTAEINSEGIGLGLMICRQIVTQSGGTIEVLSKGVGDGTLVKFSMCARKAVVRQEPSQLPEQDQLSIMAPRQSSRHVFLNPASEGSESEHEDQVSQSQIELQRESSLGSQLDPDEINLNILNETPRLETSSQGHFADKDVDF